MIRLESGTPLLAVEIWKRTLNQWRKLLFMSEDRLPKILYKILISLAAKPSDNNWDSNIKLF